MVKLIQKDKQKEDFLVMGDLQKFKSLLVLKIENYMPLKLFQNQL
jgi:hypothetical protein